MRKACGFLDSKGVFHNTKKECILAELKYDIQQNESHLKKFLEDLERHFPKYDMEGQETEYKGNYSWNEHNYFLKEVTGHVFKHLFENTELLLSMIERKKELEDALNSSLIKYEDIDRSWWKWRFKK